MKKYLFLVLACILGVFNSLNAQTTITIGSGTETSMYLPTYGATYKGSISQQIYTADEMPNISGTITSVAFLCQRATTSPITRNLEIYMLNTEKASFSNGEDWVELESSNLVYSGNVTYPTQTGVWVEIELTTPFKYEQGKNVLLCVNDVTGYETLAMKFAVEAKNDNRSIYANDNFNLFDATNITATGTAGRNLNHVQFVITSDDPDEPIIMTSTVTIGSGDGTTMNTPSYTYAYNSVSQQIYLAEEMDGKTGQITKFAFKCARDMGSVTRNFKVYMLNTNKETFNDKTDWVQVYESNLVYEGDVTFLPSGSWTTVTLDTPFTYRKDKNIVLCIYDNTGGDTGSTPMKYASENKETVRAIYKSGYSAFGTDLKEKKEVATDITNVLNQVQFTVVEDGSGDVADPNAPATPANLKAEATSDKSIDLTWDAVNGATSYDVFMNGGYLDNVTDTKYTVNGLTANTNYCFEVSALKADHESERTDEECVTTLGQQAAPTTFAFDFNDGTKGGMRVFQGSGASHLCPNWGTPQDQSTVSFVIESLKKAYYGVDGSIAVFSMTNNVLNDGSICTPDNYIVTNDSYLITETSTLEWDIRQVETGKQDQYAIVISENGTDFEAIWYERYSEAGATKAYSLADYAGKELYIGFHHYKKTDGNALCLDNVKLVTNSTLTPEAPKDMNAPMTPDDVKAIAFSATTIKVSWNAADNATKYNVYQGDEAVATNVTETSYMVSELEPGTTYCFTVTAANEETESEKSSEVCAVTFDAEDAPEAPTNLVAEALTESSIKLTWDVVENASSYKIYQDDVELITVVESTYTVTALKAGKNYCFAVTALNDGGESVKSEQVCETTLGDDSIEELMSPLNVYPNPVGDKLYVETESEMVEVAVYDIYGRMMISQQLNNSTTQQVEVSELNSGVYFVKVKTENAEVVRRIVKK